MGSVSSINPGVSDLLQSLTNLKSPVMSSQAVVTALEKAPSSDIVQLSTAANQLATVDAMFGISSSSSTSTGTSSIFAELEAEATAASSSGQSTPSALSSATPAEQLTNYESAIQSQVTQGLFGTTTTNALSGSLFNVIG
jgi:hypothetical protein